MKRIIYAILFSLPLFFNSLAWSAEIDIPLPAGAVLTDENSSESGLLPFKSMFYKISAPVDKVSNFFLKSMKEAGWEGEKQKDGALMFRKADELAFIVIVPPLRAGSQTQFSVVRSARLSEKQLFESQKDKPDPLSFMPIYPKAKQLSLLDLPMGGVSASYSTSDSMQDVIFFYKAQMLNYGWNLSGESPISEQPLDCPSCKKIETPKAQGVEVKDIKGSAKKGSLTFRRGKGESCVVHIFSQQIAGLPTEVSGLAGGNTTILVTYIESKNVLP